MKFTDIRPLPKKIKGVRWKPADSPNDKTRQFTYLSSEASAYGNSVFYGISGPANTITILVYPYGGSENLAYFYNLLTYFERSNRVTSTNIYGWAEMVDGYWTVMEDDVNDKIKQSYGSLVTAVYEDNWLLTSGYTTNDNLLAYFGLDILYYVVE